MEVLRNEQIGRYTIVQVKNENGKKGVGISRRSFLDRINDERGYQIALGRASSAATKKEQHKHIQNAFMG